MTQKSSNRVKSVLKSKMENSDRIHLSTTRPGFRESGGWDEQERECIEVLLQP